MSNFMVTQTFAPSAVANTHSTTFNAFSVTAYGLEAGLCQKVQVKMTHQWGPSEGLVYTTHSANKTEPVVITDSMITKQVSHAQQSCKVSLFIDSPVALEQPSSISFMFPGFFFALGYEVSIDPAPPDQLSLAAATMTPPSGMIFDGAINTTILWLPDEWDAKSYNGTAPRYAYELDYPPRKRAIQASYTTGPVMPSADPIVFTMNFVPSDDTFSATRVTRVTQKTQFTAGMATVLAAAVGFHQISMVAFKLITCLWYRCRTNKPNDKKQSARQSLCTCTWLAAWFARLKASNENDDTANEPGDGYHRLEDDQSAGLEMRTSNTAQSGYVLEQPLAPMTGVSPRGRARTLYHDCPPVHSGN